MNVPRSDDLRLPLLTLAFAFSSLFSPPSDLYFDSPIDSHIPFSASHLFPAFIL
jgi:hypothetical protein